MRKMFKSCRMVRQRLAEYMDGELDKCPVAEVKRHLESCKRCNAEYERMSRLGHLLEQRYARSRAFSAHLTGKVMSRIGEEGYSPARAAPSRKGWAYAAAGLVLVIAGAAVLLLRDRGTRQRIVVTNGSQAPRVTQAVAAAASSSTLRKVEEVLRRHQAPSIGPHYAGPEVSYESLFPRFLQECSLESEERLRKILR